MFPRKELFDAIARGLTQKESEYGFHSWPAEVANDGEIHGLPEEDDSEEGQDPEEEGDQLPRLLDRQKKLVLKHHVDMGHPAKEDLIQLLECAHVRPEIVRYADKEFSCDICRAHRPPSWRRTVGIPHTYQLNRLLALDTMFFKLSGDTVPVLKMVDHGTNFQVCTVMREATNHEVSRAFQDKWVRYLGCPDVVLTDGGSEFQAELERSLELMGIMQLVSNADSP